MTQFRIVALLLLASCTPRPEPEYPVRRCATDLQVSPAGSPRAVAVSGEWSSFALEPMQAQGDGRWSLELSLEPRDYAYELVVDGVHLLDPANAFTRWVGGQERSRLRVPDCRYPLLELASFVATPDGLLEVEARYLDGSERAGPDLASAVMSLDGEPKGAFEAGRRRFSLSATGLERGKHAVRIGAKDALGRPAEELYLPFWVEAEPFDWRGAILYFAFTDRFRNGDPSNDAPVALVDAQANYRGGDFAGILQAIEEGYFEKLGVRAIWISPPDVNPEGAFPGKHGKRYAGYHGYWPSAPRKVQRRFGTLEDLRALTRAAHRRGIRVISDLVLNHVHEEHPYFAEHKGEGWFNLAGSCVCGAPGCDWDARRLDCWFTGYLPDLNWRVSAAADQLAEDALWWATEADLDGFRLDAIKHLDHTGGRAIAGTLNSISRRTGIDYYLVGETFTGTEGRPLLSEYIGPNELDGQFDFPLYWPVVDVFAKGQSFKLLDEAVRASEAGYPAGALSSAFLGNHDVARFHSYAAGQVEADAELQAWGSNRPPDSTNDDEPYLRAKYAFTFLLSLQGPPLVYYGDEIGLPGAGDPDNRRMMKWSGLTAREADLLSHVRKVGSARARSPALFAGARQTLLVEDDLYVFQRDDLRGEGAVVALNRSAQERSLSLALAGEPAKAARTYRDVVSGRFALLGGASPGTLTLPARSASLYLTE
ncbi:MAG: glycosyl hydrolase [Myxococcales bacterium]|nr:glycosyl hydrolase [Myxococcales bacterium]